MPRKIDRTGEIHTTKQGYKIEIIQCINNKNCTIQFEDGVIIKQVAYREIRGKIKPDSKSRLGETYITKQGYKITIIEWSSTRKCAVQFENGVIILNKEYHEVKNGTIRNPYHPSVYGVGYLGIGKYKTRPETCKPQSKCYEAWRHILNRCYNEKNRHKYPSYKDITIDESWKNFQVFAQWHEENYKPHMDGWALDKDLFCKECKIYSPETCCFLPQKLNNLFTKSYNKAKLPICVTKVEQRYVTYFQKKYIGSSKTPEGCFEIFKKVRERQVKEIANDLRASLGERVYNALINYELVITF